jgi:hypothetical protein
MTGVAYAATITASGGLAPYTFAVLGSLPDGLVMDAASGVISGTPTAGGSTNFSVLATDADGHTGIEAYDLAINAPEITLAPGDLPDAIAHAAYGVTFSASGGAAPYTFSIDTPPPGLALAPDGSFGGTPSTDGSFPFNVGVTDANGASASASFTLEVGPPVISVSPATLPDGVAGVAYEATVSASGGLAPYTFAVLGSLPDGLVLDADSGTLAGTPSSDGSFGFSVLATDADGHTATRAYDVAITAPTLVLSPGILPGGSVGIAYAQELVASGGTAPYSIHLLDGSLPYGLELVATGPDRLRLQGTPTTDGDFAFAIGAMDANGFTTRLDYDVAIAAPTITLAPATLPTATVGTAYLQAITASGGTAPYSFFVGGGSLPPGLELASDGTLAGVPEAIGDYAFTVFATGAYGYQGSIDYVLAVAGTPPVAVDDVASTPSQQAVTIDVTANDGGNITSIELAGAPAHGSASVDGLSIVYTPDGTFFGEDSFRYTASGPGGTSAPATVSVHVAALPVPVGMPQALEVTAGESMSFDAALGASGGPITAVTIVQPPAVGTASVAGTTITYSAPVDASGVQSVGYVLSNDYGDSAPVVTTIAIDERPVAPSLHATTPMGIAVDLDLTAGATGGPFVAATLQPVSPAGAGTATVLEEGDGHFVLRFTPAPMFSGVATVGFTLSNAHATSAPGSAVIEVTARDNPALNPEVGGIIRAQVFTVREFVQAQINNVQQRMDELHEPGDKPWGFWIGGSVRHGDRGGNGAVAPASFETSGLTSGADYRFSDRFAFGGALGHGRDRTAIGDEGSRSDGRAEAAMGYGSIKPPTLPFYLDGMAGRQRITFQLQRVDPATGDVVAIPRDGVQSFSSWSSGYEHKADTWMIGSYGRMDMAQARLDAYQEQGDPLQALAFDEMAVQTRTSTLGVRGRFRREIRWGVLEPRFRVEFQRDFHDASGAVIRYADQDDGGQAYVLPGDGIDRSRAIIELGTVLRTVRGFVLRVEVRSVRGGINDSDNAISFSLQDDH